MSPKSWRRSGAATFVLLVAISSWLGAQSEAPPQSASAQEQKTAAQEKIVVPAGTKLSLVLHNAVSTRNAKPGDPVYLETVFPIIVGDRVAVPAGSYVSGEIIEAKRPGRVKGRGEVVIKLNKLILPNAYVVDMNASPTGAGTGGNEEVDPEGKIKGDTDKGADVGTVLTTTTMGTGVGAGVGGLAGNVGRGAGIGAAAGAAAGLMAVLLSRGPEMELPRGTTLDVELHRPITLDAAKANFTDPGQASSLSGPPNRQPLRRRFPN